MTNTIDQEADLHLSFLPCLVLLPTTISQFLLGYLNPYTYNPHIPV